MKNGYIYTIIFMFVISVIFTGALATADYLAADRIEVNRLLAEKKAILAALGIEHDDSDAESVYEARVSTGQVRDKTYYSGTDESGALSAYAMRFTGAGLWGTISGFIGISADLSMIAGVEFTEQNETPGLGGRITEEWFKDQFVGARTSDGRKIEYGDGIDAITGATSSSNAVLDIINDFIEQNMAYLEELR